MRLTNMHLKQIGIIHSPYQTKKEAPKQGRFNDDISELEIFDEYKAGLKDVESLTHLIVLYWGSKADRSSLKTTPTWSSEKKGIFSTRSPNRPNPITFCVAEVVQVSENKIQVKNLDALDQSPLLDIKAYSAEIDSYPEAKRKDK